MVAIIDENVSYESTFGNERNSNKGFKSINSGKLLKYRPTIKSNDKKIITTTPLVKERELQIVVIGNIMQDYTIEEFIKSIIVESDFIKEFGIGIKIIHTSEEAIQFINNHTEEIDLLMTDENMYSSDTFKNLTKEELFSLLHNGNTNTPYLKINLNLKKIAFRESSESMRLTIRDKLKQAITGLYSLEDISAYMERGIIQNIVARLRNNLQYFGKEKKEKVYIPPIESISLNEGELISGKPITIIVVEDNKLEHQLFEAILRKEIHENEFLRNFGFRLLKAYSGNEGLEIIKRHKDDIHLIFTDQKMSLAGEKDLTGTEMLTQIKDLKMRKVIRSASLGETNIDSHIFMKRHSHLFDEVLRKSFLDKERLIRILIRTINGIKGVTQEDYKKNKYHNTQ